MKQDEAKKEQEYAKKSFDNIANKYDEILFFKISARYIVDLIKNHKSEENLEVIDVACGTGNVVLECADCMPKSTFDAMDISEGMLTKAKENALEKQIENIDFQLQDITKLSLEKKYDVITCSYALFFLPKADEVLQKFTTLLKENGMVVFTSFTAKAFKPSSEILLHLLEKYGSNSAKEYERDKWENLKRVEDIERLCKMAKVKNVAIESKEIRYNMSIDEWWELFNNTVFKGMLMELTVENYELLKKEFYEAMFKHTDMDGELELVADSWFVVVS
jgi:ubiquinone/menaquinone biosynthesis C-methylase UbiE